MIPESSFDWLVFILLVLSSIGSMAQMSRFSALRDRTGDLERQLEALQEAHQKLTRQFFASLNDPETLEEQPIEAYYSDENARYTSIPSTLHDAESESK